MKTDSAYLHVSFRFDSTEQAMRIGQYLKMSYPYDIIFWEVITQKFAVVKKKPKKKKKK